MIQPCPHRISCPGLDYPIVNLSSEAVERAYWRSIGWCCNGAIKEYLSYVGREDALLGMQRTIAEQCGVCPPDPESQYSSTGTCADGTSFTMYSSESQAHADQLVADVIASGVCPSDDDNGVIPPDGGDDGGTPPGGGGTTTTIFYNTAQTCEYYCPDGSKFAYTLAAGMVAGGSQAEANATAFAYACAFANNWKYCLGALATTDCCVGEAYIDTIRVSPSKRVSFSLLSGTLPPGLSFVSGWSNTGILTLSGTPTVAGNYTFTLLANDVHNAYTSRTYTVCVVGLAVSPAGSTTVKFPDATEGTAYTATLSATSCADAPLSWQITDGALPAGLSLNESTGVVSGTPTEDGDFTFTVTLQTQAT